MTAPVVVVLTLSPDELRALVVGAVRVALAEQSHGPSTSALVDRREVARLLGVSAATITRLVAEGGPHTFVGSSPRFDVKAFRAWLEARGRAATTAKPACASIGGVRLLSRGTR